jgi:hypothetical protein
VPSAGAKPAVLPVSSQSELNVQGGDRRFGVVRAGSGRVKVKTVPGAECKVQSAEEAIVHRVDVK